MIFLIMKLRKTLKKGVIMPMSLSHKSVKKHNKKLPANVTNHKMGYYSQPVKNRRIVTTLGNA